MSNVPSEMPGGNGKNPTGQSVGPGRVGAGTAGTDGNGFPNETQHDVRPFIPVEGITEPLVGGYPDFPVPSLPDIDIDQLTALTQEIQSEAGGLAKHVVSGINDELKPVSDFIAAVQAKVIGSINLALESVLTTADKIAKKLVDGVNTSTSQVYHGLQQLGIEFPTREQAGYFLSTGDSIGALLGTTTLTSGMGNDGTSVSVSPPIPVQPMLPGPNSGRGIPTRPSSPPTGGTVPGSVPPTVPPVQPFNPPVPLNPVILPQPVQPGSGGFQPVPPTLPIPGQISPPGGMGGDQCSIGMSPCVDDPSQCCGQTSGGPSGATLPSGISGDTGCGPGMQPNPSYSAVSYKSYTTSIDSHTQTLSHGLRDQQTFCPQRVLGGFTQSFDVTQWECDGSQHCKGPPWLDGGPGLEGLGVESVCIDGACTGNPGTQLRLWVPMGYTLFYNPATMQVTAANYPLYGLQTMETVACNANIRGGGPNGQPGQQPGQPGPGQGNPRCLPKCVPDVPPACPANLNGTVPPLALPEDDHCKGLQDAIDKLKGANVKLADFIGMGKGNEKPTGIAATILQAISGTPNSLMPDIIGRLVSWADGLIRKAAAGMMPNAAEFLEVELLHAALGAFGGWFGIIPKQVTTVLQQYSNTLVHVNMPDVVAADRAWLNNAITDGTWECWVKAAGASLQEAQTIRDGERRRADVPEIFRLFRRKLIDEDTRNDLLRGRGVTDKDDRERLWKLTQEYPPFTDLIRLMRRDAFNEDLVTAGNLDYGFDQNYTDKAHDYGYAIGVEDELARYLWRAHWQIPSFTMLREMLFRLTPDQYQGQTDRFGKPLAVDRDVMFKALYADGWAPGFIDRMIEIAYLPINRTDFTWMYLNGTIDETELARRFGTVGYSPQDQDTQVAAMKTKKSIYSLQKAGFPSMRQLTQMYSMCQIDEQTLQNGIERWATTDEQVSDAMDAAQLKRDVWLLKADVETIKKSYFYGLIDNPTAISQLQEAGMDPACVPGFVQRMQRQRQRQMKQVPASTICKWRKEGLMSAEEQLGALVRLNYRPDDAAKIVADCTYQMEEAAVKAEEKAAKAAAKCPPKPCPKPAKS